MQWGNGNVTAPTVKRGLERVIVLDTETTGLLPYDRLVSLAAIRFEGGSMREHIYRVYDPRKDSHPRAAEVHGWDDWTLRFQDLFADDAEEIREWFSWADRLVMHNAEFDMRYVARELRKAEVAPLEVGTLCTMQQARQRWAGSAKLDDCLNRIGLARKGRVHGAYEDALLTAHLYFHLDGKGLGVSLPAQWPAPTNLRPAPARPAGELPRRSPKKPGRRPLRKAPAHEPNRTAEITSRAQDGLLILRHIAEAGHTNIDAQVDFIEHYIVHALSTMNVEADPELIQSLCSYALGLPGSESEAVAATLRLAAHEIDIQALGPLIINLVKADGATTDEEARVVRQFIATIRDERQRGTVAPPTPHGAYSQEQFAGSTGRERHRSGDGASRTHGKFPRRRSEDGQARTIRRPRPARLPATAGR